MSPACFAVALSSPLKTPCLCPVTFMSMVTPTAALADFTPGLGLAICHATPVKSAAARATASATTTKRLRATTDDPVISPSSETAPAAGRPSLLCRAQRQFERLHARRRQLWGGGPDEPIGGGPEPAAGGSEPGPGGPPAEGMLPKLT